MDGDLLRWALMFAVPAIGGYLLLRGINALAVIWDATEPPVPVVAGDRLHPRIAAWVAEMAREREVEDAVDVLVYLDDPGDADGGRLVRPADLVGDWLLVWESDERVRW